MTPSITVDRKKSSLIAFRPLNGYEFYGMHIRKKETVFTISFLVGAEGVEPPTLCL